ncbi:MAG: type I polyketide synthase, partial [Planctomycetota bacterium]
AVYRLLDATITFHDQLPAAGSTIVYDIHIDQFFRQGDTHLFRFRFVGSVDGRPLLSMRDGIAGFFTQAELAAGKGVVIPRALQGEAPGVVAGDYTPLRPLQAVECYDDTQLDALRRGDLRACFGPEFPASGPTALPDGRLRLVHRILSLEPGAGRHGLGRITGEADIHPDDWFLTCHFCDDMVMPGTLMYECCLHTLRVFLLRIGWIPTDSELIVEPVPGRASSLKCRGQVLQSTRQVQYQLTISEIGYDEMETPYCIADAVMSGDGRPIVHMLGMSVRIRNLKREQLERFWQQVPSAGPLFDDHHITAFADGRPSDAFGAPYSVFDNERVIARLPREPYKFLNRIMRIDGCEAFVMRAGGDIDAEYDVPADAWYFPADQQTSHGPVMPFAVLLEAALQPCGWLSAYVGSALTSQEDLRYRNLGGSATIHRAVTPDTGTLHARVRMAAASSSGGMIIQQFTFEMQDDQGLVYSGETMFGFFTKAALANQIGIRGAEIYQPSASESARSRSFDYPNNPPYPDGQLRMLDRVVRFIPDGGPMSLGYSLGELDVDAAAWYFRAHFHQDPVTPGSLGLESFIQLLKVHAVDRWGEAGRFECLATGAPHRWLYRGQVIGSDQLVRVHCWITATDDSGRQITGSGFLEVDGRVIYQMDDFSIRYR